MRVLADFAIRHEYERIKELGYRLVEVGNKINWDDFGPKLDILFFKKIEKYRVNLEKKRMRKYLIRSYVSELWIKVFLWEPLI